MLLVVVVTLVTIDAVVTVVADVELDVTLAPVAVAEVELEVEVNVDVDTMLLVVTEVTGIVVTRVVVITAIDTAAGATEVTLILVVEASVNKRLGEDVGVRNLHSFNRCANDLIFSYIEKTVDSASSLVVVNDVSQSASTVANAIPPTSAPISTPQASDFRMKNLSRLVPCL